MRLRRSARVASSVFSILALLLSPPVFGQQSSSANYQVNEVFFGAGGVANACSATYCSKQAAGEIAAGNTAGNAFRAQAGFNTGRQPYLAFSVAGGSTDLGTLSTIATATTTATFAVKTYLASGYIVQLVSDPPTNNGSNAHQMNAPSTPASPAIGVEQFGLNLVANTSPHIFGAPPVQVPDSTFSFGAVASGYDQSNKFKYVKGDTIAQSAKSTGETDYTASFIYNISDLTPDGLYTFNGTLVATSTY